MNPLDEIQRRALETFERLRLANEILMETLVEVCSDSRVPSAVRQLAQEGANAACVAIRGEVGNEPVVVADLVAKIAPLKKPSPG